MMCRMWSMVLAIVMVFTSVDITALAASTETKQELLSETGEEKTDNTKDEEESEVQEEEMPLEDSEGTAGPEVPEGAENRSYEKMDGTEAAFGDVLVESIELSDHSLVLAEGETYELDARVTPTDATDKTITWESNNTSVVMVADGTVTAQKAGNCIVTASAGGKSASCRIVVVEENPEEATYWLQYDLKEDMTATVIGCEGTGENLIIPANIGGYSVTVVGARAFDSENCEFTGNLILPDSLKIIGEDAFSCCGFTGSLTIPSSVQIIESGAFSSCDGFTGDLVIPSSVTTIGEDAFSFCSGFNGNLTIQSGVTTIGDSAFYDCSGFTGNLTLPSSIITIDAWSFSGCSGFTGSLVIPSGVKMIGEYAFRYCRGLSSIQILNRDCEIDNSAETIEDMVIFGYEGSTVEVYAEHHGRTFISFESIEGMKVPVAITVSKAKTEYETGDILTVDDITAMVSYIDGTTEKVTEFTTNVSDIDMSIGGKNFLWVTYQEGDIVVETRIEIEVKEAFGVVEPYEGATYMLRYIVGEDGTATIIGYEGTPGGDLIIPEVIDGHHVTTIRKYAFEECRGFDGSLSLPSSVMEIGARAFSNCSNLTGNLTIPDSVTTIGEYAFSYCNGFTGDLILPDSVTTIEAGAFADCSGFDGRLVLSSNITTIERFAFGGCYSLNGKLILPDSVTMIRYAAFSYCSGFTGDLILSESVAAIESGAFESCSSLSSIQILNPACKIDDGSSTIPEHVTIYGYANSSAKLYAEQYGRGFTLFDNDEVLPVAMTVLKGKTEYEAGDILTIDDITATVSYTDETENTVTGFTTNISDIDMSTTGRKTLTVTYQERNIKLEENIEIEVFKTVEPYENALYTLKYIIENDDTATITGHKGTASGDLIIPEKIDGYSVTVIGFSAFEDCSGLTGVSIPSSVESIGSSAFENCSGLTSVSILSRGASIGDYVFRGCSRLLSAGPIGGDYDFEFGWETDIPDNAFEGCDGLTSVNIPPSVKSIGSYAFDGCSSLTSLLIPSSVENIYSSAFRYCSGLTSLIIPSNVTSIGDCAFEDCSSLSSIRILNPDCEIYDGDYTIPENTTIFGYANSTAQSYSEKYSRTFISIESIGSDVVPVSLAVSKERTEYKTGDILTVDDITATVSYTDETTKTVTGFKTNVSDIDMSVAGIKTLILTYQENNVTLKAVVEIDVKDASAVVEPKFYTVTFDANGGTGLSETSRAVEEGKTLGSLPEVNRPGYTFTGWYKEADCKIRWNLSTDAVTGDIVLYAGWETASYTVSFNLQGHGTVADIKVVFGGKIEKPIDPKAEGYIFIGWYKDANCTVQWDFNKDLVEDNITLYAKWQKVVGDILPGDMPSDDVIPEGLWVADVQDTFYTGKAIKPEVHVYWNSTRLDEKLDYTVKYKNNTKVNTISAVSSMPSITITGKKHYSGSRTVYFNIIPIDLEAAAADDIAVAYNGREQRKIPTVFWKGKKLANKKDFTVSYPDGTGAYREKGNYEILITAKEGSNFTGKKTVRLSIVDPVDCKLISKAKVKKIPAQQYAGEPVRLNSDQLKVTFKNVGTLLEGRDYKVEYENNTAVGTATALIQGIDPYAGTKRVTFQIKGKPLKKPSITGFTLQKSMVYNGEEQKQDTSQMKLVVNGSTLTEGKDYVLLYSNHKNAGKAVLTIQGINEYTGTVKKSFKITAYNLKDDPEHRLKWLEETVTEKLTSGKATPKPQMMAKKPQR